MSNEPRPQKLSLEVDEFNLRFDHHAPSRSRIMRHERIRREIKHTALMILSELPSSRETSLAMTALEEALMWANAAVARRTPADDET